MAHDGFEFIEKVLFTVEVDFGSGIFTGAAYWLEVAVRPAGTGAYTALLPRQKITPAPYALALPGFWTQQDAVCPNMIGGFKDNLISAAVHGATISGGGISGSPNRVMDHYGTVGGGRNNTAGFFDGDPETGAYSTVGGGCASEICPGL